MTTLKDKIYDELSTIQFDLGQEEKDELVENIMDTIKEHLEKVIG